MRRAQVIYTPARPERRCTRTPPGARHDPGEELDVEGTTWPTRSPTKEWRACEPASGSRRPHTQPPHYVVPNEDAFRHVAEAYGDDNPLWCDPEYANRHALARTHRATSSRRRRHADRRGRGQPAPGRRPCGHEGRSPRRRPRLLLGVLPRVVAPTPTGDPGHAAQRPHRRARHAERLRGSCGARVVRRGVRGPPRSRALGPVPPHDPRRTGEGDRTRQARRGRGRSRTPTPRSLPSTKRSRPSATDAGARSRDGGRTSRRATTSDRS